MRGTLALTIALAGCGAGAGDPEPEEASAGAEAPSVDQAMAPTPFTADQIREACPDGRVDVFRTTTPDGETFHRVAFEGDDTTLARFTSTPVDADGRPVGEGETGEAPWTALRDHAAYPADWTTTRREDVTVPAGAYAAMRYTVTDPSSGAVTDAWFADDLPGPPVRHRVAEGGVVTSDMVLVSHHGP